MVRSMQTQKKSRLDWTGKRELFILRGYGSTHTRPIGSKKLKALFIHNFKQLEIENIVGCRIVADGNSFEFKIRWLGFEQDQDTWEPIITIYEDVPITVTSFVESMDDSNLKTFILRVIDDHDRIRRNQISRIRTLDARVLKLNIQKDEISTLFRGETL
eukprot:maker-scaffold_4-snap-gene-9.57-mRNA-1 protein AED:0.47 eAED:0.63 QI:0/0/0/1/1/1/2/0/158